MKLTIRVMPALVLLIGQVTGPALADNDGEKASLVRLIHELEALRPLVKEAQDQALVESRIRLNYTWLRRDLERVKSGIQDYIETPSTEPRTFEPLQGDYRQ